METQTHSVSSIKIGVASGLLLVAGGAAFAAAAIPQGNGYSTVRVICQDNTSLEINPNATFINRRRMPRSNSIRVCETSKEWQARAQEFCQGKRSRTGKVGIKTFSVAGRCKVPFSPPFSAPKPPTYGYNPQPVPPPTYGYGYNPIPPGYGYGYNPIPPGYGYNVQVQPLTTVAPTKSLTKTR